MKHDLFGRTEAEIVTHIGHQKAVIAIGDGYSGNEGIAINKERRRASLRVDERCLAEMRGEPVAREIGRAHV